MYVVINKFLVKPEFQKKFLGETKNIWIKSYKSSSGFVETLILKENWSDIFLTIDVWKAKKSADLLFERNGKQLAAESKVPKKYLSRKSYESK